MAVSKTTTSSISLIFFDFQSQNKAILVHPFFNFKAHNLVLDAVFTTIILPGSGDGGGSSGDGGGGGGSAPSSLTGHGCSVNSNSTLIPLVLQPFPSVSPHFVIFDSPHPACHTETKRLPAQPHTPLHHVSFQSRPPRASHYAIPHSLCAYVQV